jgi:acetyl esterase
MKLDLHPGYEALWELRMDVESIAKGAPTDFDTKLQSLTKDYPLPDNIEIIDSHVPGLKGAPDVPIRIYRDPESINAPLLINIHGGGFISGNVRRDDHRASCYAESVPCTVISVEYRLAPKTVFPGALEDCIAVLTWAYDHADDVHIDRERIAVFGTSAGGTLAAALCLYVRDKGGPKICCQVLNFAALDYLANTTSCLQFFEGTPLIEGKGSSGVWQQYLGGFDGSLPSYYAVPALARDLSDLPPACIITCEYDPLRDGGIDYARRLMEFAVPTELYSLPRVPHGFDMIRAPLTNWIREGLYLSLRREFGMLK